MGLHRSFLIFFTQSSVHCSDTIGALKGYFNIIGTKSSTQNFFFHTKNPTKVPRYSYSLHFILELLMQCSSRFIVFCNRAPGARWLEVSEEDRVWVEQ